MGCCGRVDQLEQYVVYFECPCICLLQLIANSFIFIFKVNAEKNAIKRQSAVLISNAMSDQKLAEALLKIEDLTKALTEQKQTSDQQVSISTHFFHITFNKSMISPLNPLEYERFLLDKAGIYPPVPIE